MLIGRRESFAIEYELLSDNEPDCSINEFSEVIFFYWCKSKIIGDPNLCCYLGDLLSDLSIIVKDNGARVGGDLCKLDFNAAFKAIYDGIYRDNVDNLNVPARFSIAPSLSNFSSFLIFCLTCEGSSRLLFSTDPFIEIDCYLCDIIEVNGALRRAYNELDVILNI